MEISTLKMINKAPESKPAFFAFGAGKILLQPNINSKMDLMVGRDC